MAHFIVHGVPKIAQKYDFCIKNFLSTQKKGSWEVIFIVMFFYKTFMTKNDVF